MELDKRIVNGRKPFDCVDAGISETVKSFIGKKGYFANHISEFTDISDLEEDVLTFINPDEPDCEVYKASCETWEYFLPSEWVKEPEKKYRPYTLEEFKQRFNVGWAIKFRGKHSGTDYLLVFNGYVEYHDGAEPVISLGNHGYTLKELFEDYEWIDSESEGYIPFGIKE